METPTETTHLHVIFGAGPLGAGTAEVLPARGHRVRLCTRTGTNPLGAQPRLEIVKIDASDPASTASVVAVSAGAAALYHCINVPYPSWRRILPPIMGSLLTAAASSHARVVEWPRRSSAAPITTGRVRCALADLGDGPTDRLGRAWIAPTARAMSFDAAVHAIAALAGRRAKVLVLRRTALRAFGLVSGMARELSEMLVQFENDFEVDSTAFESAFGWRATPLEDGFAATMERVRSANRS